MTREIDMASEPNLAVAPTAAGRVPRDDHLHRLLIAELSNAGCFRPATLRCAAYGALIVACYAAGYATLLTDPGLGVRALAIATLAFFSVQAGFVAHEAGHGAITRDRRLATLLGHVFHTLLTGLSSSYFRHIHGLHHPHCNDRGRDPDMQSEFVAMYRQSALSKTGLGKLISRHQGFLIWVLIGLQGFTLKIDGLSFVRRNPRRTRLDQLFLLLHAVLWSVPPVLVLGFQDAWLNYSLVTMLIGFYVGSIFVVNHVGTRVIEPDESISFFRQEISVTRNLGASRLHDFIFGGVNNHIEHHLFPSMPTGRLRAARRITREFCRRHGIPYKEMSWLEAAREVTRHFKAMSALVPS
jgi:fatty acid desaturase